MREEEGMTRWWDGITDPMDMSLSKLWKMVKDRQSGMLQCTGSQSGTAEGPKSKEVKIKVLIFELC